MKRIPIPLVATLILVFVIGTGIGAAPLFFYLRTHDRTALRFGYTILFPERFFYSAEDFVALSGTLTGPDQTYPNNTYSIGCYRDRRECWLASIEEIQPHTLGQMAAPIAYQITSWSDTQIVAVSDANACKQVVLTIDRAGRSLSWIEQPTSPPKNFCTDSDASTKNYSLEDSPGWKELKQRSGAQQKF